MKQSVKIKGLNELEQKILKSINESLTLKVGIFGKQDSDIVKIAAVNEFGTETAGVNHNVKIPERSFLRSTFIEKKQNIERGVRANIKKVIAGMITQKELMDKTGLAITRFIQEKILSNIPPENADITKERKGSSHTLIDTGRLLNSIKHEVAEK